MIPNGKLRRNPPKFAVCNHGAEALARCPACRKGETPLRHARELPGRRSRLADETLAELFAADPDRVARLSARLELPRQGGVLFDWSKTHLTDELLGGFEALAEAAGFAEQRRKLFAGEVVNPTENRAAEHSALRGVGKEASVEEAAALLERMKLLVEAIHEGALGEVSHLIHIGIGGSALGPALAVDALARDCRAGRRPRGLEHRRLALEAAFAACDPATTLVAVASKTFTTIETMTNAASALALARGERRRRSLRPGRSRSPPIPKRRSNGASTRPACCRSPRASAGAIRCGRRSASRSRWRSAGRISRPCSTAPRRSTRISATPTARANLPLRAAFADQLYARLRGAETRAVFAYDERLRLFPSYLQQLEMESNGKSVTADGAPVDGPTAPITWGGVGTDAQHAVFQLLHQGTHLIPVDFIASIAPGDALDPAHHRILLMNCFAQGAALMAGKPSDDPRARLSRRPALARRSSSTTSTPPPSAR